MMRLLYRVILLWRTRMQLIGFFVSLWIVNIIYEWRSYRTSRVSPFIKWLVS